MSHVVMEEVGHVLLYLVLQIQNVVMQHSFPLSSLFPLKLPFVTPFRLDSLLSDAYILKTLSIITEVSSNGTLLYNRCV